MLFHSTYAAPGLGLREREFENARILPRRRTLFLHACVRVCACVCVSTRACVYCLERGGDGLALERTELAAAGMEPRYPLSIAAYVIALMTCCAAGVYTVHARVRAHVCACVTVRVQHSCTLHTNALVHLLT